MNSFYLYRHSLKNFVSKTFVSFFNPLKIFTITLIQVGWLLSETENCETEESENETCVYKSQIKTCETER